jgi:hypothetical protein
VEKNLASFLRLCRYFAQKKDMDLPEFSLERRSPFRELQLVLYKAGKIPAALLDDSTAKNLYKKEQIGFFKRIKNVDAVAYEPLTLNTAVLLAVAYSVEAWDKYRSTLSLSPNGPFAVFDNANEKVAEGEYHYDDVNKTPTVGGISLPSAKRQQYLIFQMPYENKALIIKANSTLLQAINLSVKKVYQDFNKKAPSFVWPSMLCKSGQRWIFSQKVDADGMPVFVAIDKEGNRAKDKGDAFFMPYLIAEYVGDKVPSAEQTFEQIKSMFV